MEVEGEVQKVYLDKNPISLAIGKNHGFKGCFVLFSDGSLKIFDANTKKFIEPSLIPSNYYSSQDRS